PGFSVVFPLMVSNVPPTLTPPAATLDGQTVSLSLGATDPSKADRDAGFTYTVDWGDGTIQTIDPMPGNGTGLPPLSYTYAASGAYLVQVTATDQSGAVSQAAKTLVVIGTAGADNICSKGGTQPGDVEVKLNGHTQPLFNPTESILIDGQAGS